ncbi:hypothetical protein CRI93_10065 [Longimonas halophila]|uniref:Preprotein translocase subunit SecA n=1 Tax=Longimonas halophila TaxID=1469170 RepID=A0A2H3P4M9_9BACT|nr:hypothetical protein [Longimonas halophila]PEN06612.1 hypothetical protein CRI93_10065 [Longimonas halophila]
MNDTANERQTRREVVVDAVMLVLIVANLALIVFDWTFEYEHFRTLLQATIPAVDEFYATKVDPNFLLYDLAFVAVFVVEIVIRWGLAIYRGTYRRWYFYPLVHWYDVLGCVPVSTFRSLRVLRIVVVIRKMQRLGLVDLKQTAAYETFIYYRDAFLQDLTDRVVLRIIGGIQEEVATSDAVVEQITQQAILPRRNELINAMTHRLQAATAHAYDQYRPAFQTYLDGVITQAVQNNREISTIGMIPGVGSTIARLLEHAISDIVYNVLNQIMDDLGEQAHDQVLSDITALSADAAFSAEHEQEINELVRALIVESLDVVKNQIQVYEWTPTRPSTNATPDADPPMHPSTASSP